MSLGNAQHLNFRRSVSMKEFKMDFTSSRDIELLVGLEPHCFIQFQMKQWIVFVIFWTNSDKSIVNDFV